jgi:translation initiation factor IF-3
MIPHASFLFMTPQKPRGDEPRINQFIRAPQIRVIDSEGTMLGLMSVPDALRKAEAADLDLVEIVPNGNPPVCKIMDYGKYKYEAQKKAHEAKKKQKVVVVKELKLRPTIDKHDLEIKIRNAIKFFEEGDKVRFSLKFRGREMARQDIGRAVIDRVQEALTEHSKVEYGPRMEGNQIVLILGPK